MVQSLGQKVFSLGYDLNIDGYSASEISIMSSHLFEGHEIISMAYQKIPDSLLWFVLDDGKFVSCTYNPEHEVIGWAKHESHYEMKNIVALTARVQTDIYMVTRNDKDEPVFVRLRKRSEESYVDLSFDFESIARTLRLNYGGEEGSTFNTRNLISRATISALQSKEAWVAPGNIIDDADNWERRRKVIWEYSKYVSDSDVQLDNGFSDYACIQIRTSGLTPLTIVAITPQLTTGG